MAGKYSEAEVLSKSLKGALEAVEGKGSERTLLARKIYASSLLSLKREKLGEKAQQEVVESSTFAFGENHVKTLRERLNYAGLLRNVGKVGEAEQETREVEIKAKEQLGLSHKITREARFMNGYEMCLLKRTEEGIPKMAAVIMEIERATPR